MRGLVPIVDPDRCVNCGACAPACPTDAVVVSDLAERRLVDAVAGIRSEHVTLRCDVAPNTQAPGGGVVVRHVRCLAALGSDHLHEIAVGGRTISLDLSSCTACPLGAAAEIAVESALTLNAWHAATGRELPAVDLIVAVDPPTSPDGPGGTVVDARRPAMTRRGWFSSMRRRAASVVERAGEPVPGPIRLARGPAAKRLPQDVPASRRRLLDTVVRPARDPDHGRRVDLDGTSFAVVRADADRCSACGLCAKYCPTGALAFDCEPSGDSHGFELSFRAGPCIDCGICAAACPEDAISFDRQIDADRLLDRSWSPIVAGELRPCSGCGLPTVHRQPGDDRRCFSCRLGAGPVSALRDDAGLMSDLLLRTDATQDL